MTPLLAQSSDLTGKVTEPGFAQWVVYLLVFIYVAEKIVGGIMRLVGRSPSLHVRAETRAAAVPADKGELDKLQAEFEELREEQTSQHNAALRAGEQRVSALSEMFDRETDAITAKMEAQARQLNDKLDVQFAALHEKVNTIALSVAHHGSEIPHLKDRLDDLGERHNRAVTGLHARVDDLMRRSAAS